MAEINTIIDQITHWGLTGLWKLVFAVIIWFVGKKVISISLRLLKKIFDKGSLGCAGSADGRTPDAGRPAP